MRNQSERGILLTVLWLLKIYMGLPFSSVGREMGKGLLQTLVVTINTIPAKRLAEFLFVLFMKDYNGSIYSYLESAVGERVQPHLQSPLLFNLVIIDCCTQSIT